MEYRTHGKILKGVGGLYTIKLCPTKEHELHFDTPSPLADKTVLCSASGSFRHNHVTPLVGDEVEIIYTDLSLGDGESSAKSRDIRISHILDRKNELIRPPMANLDVMFISMAAAHPSPVISTVDKLIAIAEHNSIEPVLIIGKRDLDPKGADELRSIYERCGFDVFTLSASSGEGVEAIRKYIGENVSPHLSTSASCFIHTHFNLL